jgi:hypothetical protein
VAGRISCRPLHAGASGRYVRRIREKITQPQRFRGGGMMAVARVIRMAVV